jgi:hypothetical protein
MDAEAPAVEPSSMAQHVDLLGLLYIIWGALSLVVGVAILVLAFGALAIIATADRPEQTAGLAASLTAVAFFLLGGGGLAWGAAHSWSGLGVRRYRPWARLVALALAIINLFFLPFGTALGIYALWVLITDQGRRLFVPAERTDAPLGPGQPV